MRRTILSDDRFERFADDRRTPSGVRFTVSYGVIKALYRAAVELNASEADADAIERLGRFEATADDVASLAPFAEHAGLTWGQLFPELATTEGR